MSSLKVSDVFCYICRGVLIEPVTLPCFHVFCLNCFEQSMLETSHSCPLCRKRISNWIRSVKKSNKLIDANLWEKIKEQFKEQVRLKLNGEDDGLDQIIQEECDAPKPAPNNGEVAAEFSKQLASFQKEREREKEAEELASKELIDKLKIEEEERLQSIRERNLKRLKQDEKMAKMMQEEMKKEILKKEACDKKNHNTRQKRKSIGPMDGFLKGLSALNKRQSYRKSPSKELEAEIEGDASPESTDSLRMEMNLFKPIKKVLRTPPKRYPDGRVSDICLRKVTPVKLSSRGSIFETTIVEGKKIHSAHSAFVDAISGNQKSEEEEEEDDDNNDYDDNDDDDGGGERESSPKRLKFSMESEMGILKDITLGENNDSNSQCSNAQDEMTKKKSGSKLMQENLLFPLLGKYHSGGKGDEENDLFETQDYLNPSPTIENKLIEEQRRIEEIILQERKDRELAMKLSREWEKETETRRKPQTRSMLAETVKKNKNNSLKSSKTQQTTLTKSGTIKSRNRPK